MRRFLKGDENMIRDVMWALKHNSSADGVCNSITAQTGFTLWDLVSYDGKHNEENGERNQDGRIIIIAGTVVQKDRAEKRTLSDCGKTR